MSYRCVCNRCDSEPSDGIDGYCAQCRDDLEEEEAAMREVFEMDDDEYEARIRSLRVTQAGLTNALEGVRRSVKARRVA